MKHHPLKLVTVVGETVIMEDIAKEGLGLGASGYTLTEVIGQGSRSARNAIVTGSSKTMKAEFVVSADVADKILEHVVDNYLEHYACIAWVTEVLVAKGEAYVGG